MADNDGGTPEEVTGKTDQSDGIEVDAREPYRLRPEQNADWQVFETYDDLIEYAPSIVNTEPLYSETIVVVVDVEGSGLKLHKDKAQFFVGRKWKFGYHFMSLIEWGLRHKALADKRSKRPSDGSEGTKGLSMDEQMAQIAEVARGVKVGSQCGVPYLVPDPAIDFSRPETQIEDTTSTTTGITTTTKTASDPYTAGTVTTTEVSAATEQTSIADQVKNLKVGDVVNAEQLKYMSGSGTTNITDGLKPCLPDTTGTGSGSVSPEPKGPDAIIAAARAKAAAPIAAIKNAIGGANVPTTPSATSPSTVTAPSPSSTNSAPADTRPPNVYIYKSMDAGFDRYDFNTGKKVFTPETGPSIEPLPPEPRTSTSANQIGPQ